MVKPELGRIGNVQKGRHFYRFGSFRLEPEERNLLRDGKPLHLAGKPFDILLLFVRNPGNLLRRDKIIHEVWSAHISEGNLDVHLTTIRKVLKEKYIEVVPGQGYRFTEPVTEGFDPVAEEGSPPTNRTPRALIASITILAILATIAIYYVKARRTPRAVSQDSPPAVALYRKALDYEQAGDDDQAATTLDQALALDPRYNDACLRAAYLAYELGQIPKASGYLTHCKAAEAADEAPRLKAQALSELLADNSVRARELYQLLVDRYPGDLDAQYRFSEVATNLDHLEEAEKAVKNCLAAEPENPYCRFQLMYVRIKQNRFNDVLTEYGSIRPPIKDYPWFDEPVGVALWGNGQLDDATKTFEHLTRRRGVHGTSHFTTGKEWLAEILLYEGRVKEGIKGNEQMMETSDNASSRGGDLVYLARIHALLGDVAEAKKLSLEGVAVSEDPGDFTAAAVVLATVGDSPDVERVLKLRSQKTTASLSPGNDHLIRGLLALAKENISNAIDEIGLARELNPRDDEAAYWLGIAYLRDGNYKSALDMFKVVRELKGIVFLDDVTLLLPLSTSHIAECYERLGDSSSAAPFREELAKLWASADDDLKARVTGFPGKRLPLATH